MDAYFFKHIEDKFDECIPWTVRRKKHSDPSQGVQKAKRIFRCMNPNCCLIIIPKHGKGIWKSNFLNIYILYPDNFFLLKYEISNYYRIIYTIFDFSFMLLSLSFILNHLLIVSVQCFPQLLFGNNFFFYISHFQPLSIFLY